MIPHSFLRTLRSLRRPGGGLYWEIDWHGDDRLDSLLRAGAGDERALLRWFRREFLPFLPLPLPRVPSFGCSTFLARTPEGRVLFGRNFDLNLFAPPLSVRMRPPGAFASVSTTGLLFLGYGERRLPDSPLRKLPLLAAPFVPVDGVNERGFAVAVLLVPGEKPVRRDTGRPPLLTTAAVRMLLDRAATVDEALALLGRFDMRHSAGLAYHFHLADATGASAVVEWDQDGAPRVVRTPPGAHQVCTNFRLGRRPAEPSARHGTDRYDALEAALRGSGGRVASARAALGLLAAVARPRAEWGNGDLTAGTQWSAVFDLTGPSVLLAPNCDFAAPFRRTPTWAQ